MLSTEPKKVNQFVSFIALTKASLLSAIRNPMLLFFSFAFPFIFIMIFGLIGQSSPVFKIGLRPSSDQNNPIITTLSEVEVLEIIRDKTERELDAELSKGQIPVAIRVERIELESENSTPKYKLYIETSAADPQNSQTVSLILEKIIQDINLSIQQGEKTIEVMQSEVSGRKFTKIDFILPGQLAFALLLGAMFGVAMTLISLREQLIIKLMFVTPTKKITILLAEVASKVIFGVVQALVIIIVGNLVFNFTLANGLITLIEMTLLSMIGVMVFLSFGLIIASLAKDEQSASPIANIIMMPQLFLSGAFFPIESFPEFIQPIARILPMTFLNDAFKSVAFEGNSILTTVPQILGLTIWGIILYLIAAMLFKWE